MSWVKRAKGGALGGCGGGVGDEEVYGSEEPGSLGGLLTAAGPEAS